MGTELILASTSQTRAALLRQAGVAFTPMPPRVDEAAIKAAMLAEQASPRDIADTLAEHKARKLSDKFPEALVLGADQVLTREGRIFDKPGTPAMARDQLLSLRGGAHRLLSAAVVYRAGRPHWRHVATVKLVMRNFSTEFIDGYIGRNWPEISYAAGAYQIEAEGVRLFSHIEGSHFAIQGLPMLELLTYLTDTGVIPS